MPNVFGDLVPNALEPMTGPQNGVWMGYEQGYVPVGPVSSAPPASAPPVTPAPAAPAPATPTAVKPPRPKIMDFKQADGTGYDVAAYNAAVDAWEAWAPPAAPGTTAPPATPVVPPPATTPPVAAPTAPPMTGAEAAAAWDQFRNSTNYQFREAQGLEAINQGYAARGTLQSGAAQKALLEWNQNYAANELANYQNLLAGQQAMGVGAAGAVAGQGQALVGQVTANNNSAGQAAANAALIQGQGAANSALVQGQGAANMWGTVGSAVGQVAGAANSSYQQNQWQPYPYSPGYGG